MWFTSEEFNWLKASKKYCQQYQGREGKEIYQITATSHDFVNFSLLLQIKIEKAPEVKKKNRMGTK